MEKIINNREEAYVPESYRNACEYLEGCKEALTNSIKFEQECLGAGQGCIRAHALSIKGNSPEGWREYFHNGGTYEIEFPVGRGIKEDIVYQSKYLHPNWEDD